MVIEIDRDNETVICKRITLRINGLNGINCKTDRISLYSCIYADILSELSFINKSINDTTTALAQLKLFYHIYTIGHQIDIIELV